MCSLVGGLVLFERCIRVVASASLVDVGVLEARRRSFQLLPQFFILVVCRELRFLE